MSEKLRWCFTLNNYTTEEEKKIKTFINEDTVKFAVIGRETGDSGTPHLQGYVNMKKKKRLTAMKKILGKRAHIESAKGTDKENNIYCSKGEDIMLRIGEPVVNGLNKVPFRLAIMKKMYRENKDVDFEEMGPEWDSCWIMHKGKIKEAALHKDMLDKKKKLKTNYDKVVWNKWQKELLDMLETPPDPRKVVWIWDIKGSVGKSYITRYLKVMKDALDLDTTTKKDVSYAYNGQNIVIFDMARHVLEYINYATIEAIKNGSIFSPKYESHGKIFDIPHVIIFANRRPDMEKMSEDRWDIREIDAETKEFLITTEVDMSEFSME